jgi:hypothetical protein
MNARQLDTGKAPASCGLGRGHLTGVVVGVAVLAGLAGPAFAQFVPAKGREYKEFHNPVNPVRGEAVLGLAVLPTAEAQKSGAVEVWLPAALQLETLTADGRFRGVGAYSGSTGGGQWVELKLTPGTSRPGDPMTLALSVRGPGPALFVARWKTDAARPAERLRIYVNARRADIFLRAGTTLSRCVAINIPQPLRFDAYCDVSRSDIPASGELTLIRKDQFDEQEQTITVNARGLR